MKAVLAYDFGASSGRAIAAYLDKDGRIKSYEVHRFLNEPVMLNGRLYWDFLRLFHEIKKGIVLARQLGYEIESIGIDTWGVDFGLLDKNGNLMQNPLHYRDKITDCYEEFFDIMGRNELYEKTGIQFMQFNTIFQLFALKRFEPELLERADKLLFMPDLMNYFLTGSMTTEYTIASTAQLLDAGKRDWDFGIIDRLGIKRSLFTDVTKPGAAVGMLKEELCQELGVKPCRVFTVPSHDTASAVLSVPTQEKDFVYISCGTWSLLGTELDRPLINKDSFGENFTNEGGYGNTVRFLKNIIGLWIMQETKRYWDKHTGEITMKEIDRLSLKSKGLRCFIDPSDNTFLPPGNMPERISAYLESTGQYIPVTQGEYARCITESLALDYNRVVKILERLTDRKFKAIHIVGGGIKDRLLCQFTANSTGKKVISGPSEATAAGNIASQLISLGYINNMKEARRFIEKSYEINVYEPEDRELWSEAYERYLRVTGREKQ